MAELFIGAIVAAIMGVVALASAHRPIPIPVRAARRARRP